MDKTTYEKAHKLNIQITAVNKDLETLKSSIATTFRDGSGSEMITFLRRSSGTYGVIAEELRLHAITRLAEFKVKLEKELKNL